MKFLSTAVLLLSAQFLFGQGTLADYTRAQNLKKQLTNKIENLPGQFYWNDKGDLFWYDRNTLQGKEYILVNPQAKTKEQLFDLTKVFSLVDEKLGRKYLELDDALFRVMDDIAEAMYMKGAADREMMIR